MAVLFISQHGFGRRRAFLDECGCSVIEQLSSAGMSVFKAQTDMLHPLIMERSDIACSPLCLRAVLFQICTKVCVNPACSLHRSGDNYELLQARLFVSNSLILRIIIDHRCLAGCF